MAIDKNILNATQMTFQEVVQIQRTSPGSIGKDRKSGDGKQRSIVGACEEQQRSSRTRIRRTRHLSKEWSD